MWVGRVQVVLHYPDYPGVGVGQIHQPAHLMGKVLHGMSLGYGHAASAGQGFAGQKQVAGTGPAVLEASTPRLSRLRWDGRPGVGQESIKNLELLCNQWNHVRANCPQEYLLARLREPAFAGWSRR